MIESTARAERTSSQSSAPPFYAWDVAQKRIAIHLSLDMMDKLENEVVQSFRSVTQRGSEIGGVLLGTVIPGARPIVCVQDYELVACEYSRGPLYRLSDTESAHLGGICAAAADRNHGRLAVVGFFRSNTRKTLALDADDLALMKERFSDPLQVALLVRPFATKASVGGFFIWEEGQIHAEASYQEFPFTRSQVAVHHESAAPDPSGVRTAARGQVVPIASRRDGTAAAPAPAPEPAAVEKAPVAPPPPPPAEAQASPRVKEAPPRVKEVPPQVKEAPPQVKETPPAVMREQAEPETPVDLEPRPARRFGLSKAIWIPSGAAIAALLMVLLVYPGILRHERKTPPPAPAADSSSLALRVERNAGQLLLTWNREAEAVRNATRAALSISDGPQHENVELDLAQLRNGSVVYSPATGDVSFRLEVTGAQGKSLSEHVRVLGTRPSPMPPAGSQNANAALNLPAGEDQPATGAENEAGADGATGETAAPAPRQNLSSVLAERLRPAGQTDLLEPPSLAGVHAGTAPAAGLAALSGTTNRVPLPPPVQPPAPVQAPVPVQEAARPAAPVKAGGRIEEARLLTRKDPIYPSLARQARIQGVVQVEAKIGRDGRVMDVKTVSGHPLLSQAAAEAVRQWVYSPTRLNGDPIEAVTRVAISFDLSRR